MISGTVRRLGRRPLARRTILAIVKLVARRGVVLVGPGRGLRLQLHGSNPGYLIGASEPLVQELIAQLHVGDVLYDIGANIGYFSLLAARQGATAIAFEPHPEAADLLVANAARNQLSVDIHRVAVGDQSGEVLISAGAHLTARVGEQGISVPVVAVDDLQGLRAPTAVKIDVEGYEEQVLAGMEKTLRLHRPLVICEIHGATLAPCRKRLEDLGYRTALLDDGGMPHLVARIAS